MKNISIKKKSAKPSAKIAKVKIFKLFCFALTIFSAILFFSCKTIPKQNRDLKIRLSRNILGTGQLTAFELADFFLENNNSKDRNSVVEFAKLYVKEAADEGVNSDAAFAQMCLETGFLRFGGLVRPDFHNYCGLGAIDAERPGEKFATEALGVRAHIQHLHAYATLPQDSLKNELVDPRYNWVHKTKFARDIFELTGAWAADPDYGKKIDEILNRMEKFTEEKRR